MFFKQFYDNHLSQASYLVGCQRTGEAIVIDPVRDLTKYMEVTLILLLEFGTCKNV